jgi:hypothetical protein
MPPAQPTEAKGSCGALVAGDSTCAQESIGGPGQFDAAGPSEAGWAKTNTGPKDTDDGYGVTSGDAGKCGQRAMSPAQRKRSCSGNDDPAPTKGKPVKQ